MTKKNKAGYEPAAIELLPKLIPEYEIVENMKRASTVRPLTFTPDFVGENWVIEVKGYFTIDARIKGKLFKHYLHSKGFTGGLFLIKSLKELEDILPLLKQYDCKDKFTSRGLLQE